MGKIVFFIQEGFRAMRRSAAPSVAAVVTILVTVLLLGVLIPVLQTTQSKSNEVRDQLELKAFLFLDATPDETNELQTRIEGSSHVESVDYIDPDEALAIMEQRLEDDSLIEELNSN